MKRKLRSAILTLVLTFFAAAGSVVVYGQGANVSADFNAPNNDIEKSNYTMGEGEPTPPGTTSKTTTTPPQKDSVAVRPARKVADPLSASKKPVAEEDDDSVLSFNFLYFIIRKYKLQDIID
jgi:hypothetical protein